MMETDRTNAAYLKKIEIIKRESKKQAKIIDRIEKAKELVKGTGYIVAHETELYKYKF
jgi:hypothetical protein